MHRYAKKLPQLLRSFLLVSLISATSVHAAENVDLIIDTDPGADDVVALLFALASPEELNIRALTTVAGNVRLDKTSRNARLAREWAGREDVPVYAGAPRPLMRTPIYAENIHGKEGLSGVAVYEPKKGLEQGSAVNYLFADPQAAEVVLKSGVKLTYLPLDVTHKILTSEARLKQIAALNNNASKLVSGILNEYVKGDMEHYGLPGGPVHDATVVAYLLKPELFTGRSVNVVVDSREGPTFGQTVVDWYDGLKAPKNAFWVESGDAQGFFDLLTQRLARLK